MRWSGRAYRKGRCVAVGSRAIYRGEHGPARAATTLARGPPRASPRPEGASPGLVVPFCEGRGGRGWILFYFPRRRAARSHAGTPFRAVTSRVIVRHQSVFGYKNGVVQLNTQNACARW